VAGRTPLYLQIYDELRREIRSGGLPAGASLGPQRALSRRFGVTLMTLRQGLARLERDGLIRRRHGLGTFVAPDGPPSIDYDILSLQSFAGDLAARGEPVETRLLAVGSRRPPGAVAAALGGGPVVAVGRLRLVRGRPLSYQMTYLPAPLGAAVREHDLRLHSLGHVLEHKLGITITRASETVSAVRLGPGAARTLGRRPGSPAFRADRVSFRAGDVALLVDRVWIPGGPFRITRELRYDIAQEGP
jgi:GntR family transcriptional regulator